MSHHFLTSWTLYCNSHHKPTQGFFLGLQDLAFNRIQHPTMCQCCYGNVSLWQCPAHSSSLLLWSQGRTVSAAPIFTLNAERELALHFLAHSVPAWGKMRQIERHFEVFKCWKIMHLCDTCQFICTCWCYLHTFE